MMKHWIHITKAWRGPALALAAVTALAGCHQDMWNQPRYTALQPSEFFADGMSSRPIPANTVQFGKPMTDSHFYTGMVDGEFATELPPRFELNEAFLRRGQLQYQIYCTPCHGQSGDGQGMITLRGFKEPPDYREARLKGMPLGYFYDVITNGFGTMYRYDYRVKPEDRWAIAAYIRVLQSTDSDFDALTPEEQQMVLEPAGPTQEARLNSDGE
jgi:hypothetical protein